MHVGLRDADDESWRRSDAAQIDDVDVQKLAEERCVRSEAAPPKAVADNDLGPRPRCVVRGERFADQRDAENFEELRCDVESAQTLASIASGQIHSPPPIAGDGL